jgi:hypothetical protein
MIRPTLNINGSDAFDLINPRRNAMALIDEVIEALKQATPNGRDYPSDLEQVALVADRNIHFDRLAALHTLREELLDEALHIQQQEKATA